MGQSGHILITGGAGFIGSHLAERLLKEGENVVIIDDCSTGSWTNLADVRDHPRLQCFESSVSRFPCLDETVRGARAVFHLAAAVGVDLVVKSPIHTIQTNLDETEAILEAAAKAQVPVLLASTSEVYGKSQKEAFSEDDDLLIGPPNLGRWSYACSKLMDEFLALAYTRERGLPVIITRLFNTVGPRQTGRYGMVLPRFIDAAKAGKPVRVFGTGRQTRCFCAVADTVEALIRLERSRSAHGEIFNIGSTHEIAIGDLAQRVIDLAGTQSTIEYVPYATAYAPGFEDMLRRKPMIEKLERIVQFRPQISLDDIILQMR